MHLQIPFCTLIPSERLIALCLIKYFIYFSYFYQTIILHFILPFLYCHLQLIFLQLLFFLMHFQILKWFISILWFLLWILFRLLSVIIKCVFIVIIIIIISELLLINIPLIFIMINLEFGRYSSSLIKFLFTVISNHECLISQKIKQLITLDFPLWNYITETQ